MLSFILHIFFYFNTSNSTLQSFGLYCYHKVFCYFILFYLLSYVLVSFVSYSFIRIKSCINEHAKKIPVAVEIVKSIFSLIARYYLRIRCLFIIFDKILLLISLLSIRPQMNFICIYIWHIWNIWHTTSTIQIKNH